jgi:hypothetical protein
MSEMESTNQPNEYGEYGYNDDVGGLGFDGLPFVNEDAMPGDDVTGWDRVDYANDDFVVQSESSGSLEEPFLAAFDSDIVSGDVADERQSYGDSTAGIVHDDVYEAPQQPQQPPADWESPPRSRGGSGRPGGADHEPPLRTYAPPQEAQNVHIVSTDRPHPPSKGPVHEGVVVSSKNPDRPFDRAVLSLDTQVVLIGRDRPTADRAHYDTVVSMAENLNKTPGRKVIIAVETASGDEPLLAKLHSPEIYNLVRVEATSDALTARLTPKQLSETLAALTSEDPGERAQMFSLYDTLTHGLATETADDEGNITLESPTIDQLIAAINFYTGAQRGDRGTELKALTPEQWEVIEQTNLVGRARQEAWKPLWPKAKAYLEASYPNGGATNAVSLQELKELQAGSVSADDPDITTPNTTVLLVTPGADQGESLRAAKVKMMAALVPWVKTRTEWFGEPAGFAVSNADRLPNKNQVGAEVTDELMEAVYDKKVPTVFSATRFTEETPWYLRQGAFGIMTLDSTSAKIISDVLGTTIRQDLTGISAGLSNNDGTNLSGGTGANQEPGSPFALGTSSNSGGGVSFGLSANVGDSITVGEGPRVRPADLRLINPGQIAIIGAWANIRRPLLEGMYAVRGRERIGDWPPPGDDLEVVMQKYREAMAAMEARYTASLGAIRRQFGALAAGQPAALESSARHALPAPPVENNDTRHNSVEVNMNHLRSAFLAYQKSVRNHNSRVASSDRRRVPSTLEEYARIKCGTEYARAIERARQAVLAARQAGNKSAREIDFCNPEDYTFEAWVRRERLSERLLR